VHEDVPKAAETLKLLPERGGDDATGLEPLHDSLVLRRAHAELAGEDVVSDVEHGLRRQLEPPFGQPLAP
jgi:hypothetical protein